MEVNEYGFVSEELINLVDMLGLYDMSLQGSSFTFLGSGQAMTHSKIDRFFFVSDGVGPWFSNLSQKAILRIVFPIIGSFVEIPFGYRPFRFFNV